MFALYKLNSHFSFNVNQLSPDSPRNTETMSYGVCYPVRFGCKLILTLILNDELSTMAPLLGLLLNSIMEAREDMYPLPKDHLEDMAVPPVTAALLGDLLPRLLLMDPRLEPIRCESDADVTELCVVLIKSMCRLWNWFTSVDVDRSGAITASELGTLALVGFLFRLVAN